MSKHLQFKNLNDCFDKVAEIQVRHEVGEINDKHAAVQIVACKLYFEIERYRRKMGELPSNFKKLS